MSIVIFGVGTLGKLAYYYLTKDMKLNVTAFVVDRNEKQKQRLIRGNTTPDFEELKWLQPGISWSPDGKSISFASKSGQQDSIIIVDIFSDSNWSAISFPVRPYPHMIT